MSSTNSDATHYGGVDLTDSVALWQRKVLFWNNSRMKSSSQLQPSLHPEKILLRTTPGGRRAGEDQIQNPLKAVLLRTHLTIESNSLGQQNLIGYLIANLKPKLREERESQIHISSWKLHFVSHLCS